MTKKKKGFYPGDKIDADFEEEFILETGIPVPPSTRTCKFPFATMEVGQSFPFDIGLKAKVANSSSRYGKLHGKKFIVRKVEEKGEVKGRCWRDPDLE